MASNISVSVTADTTQLRAQLALAQQDLKSYAAQLRQAAADIKASGQASAEQSEALNKASAGYNEARSQINSFRAGLGELKPAAEGAGLAINHGITRELMVLAHELSQGNITRASGSIMVLGERANIASGGMMAAVAAGALLARALFEVAENALKAATELRNVANASVLQGRNGLQAMADAQLGARQMAATGAVSSSSAALISAAIQRLNNVSDQTRQTLTQLGPALNMALGGGDAEKTAQKIDEAFGDTSRIEAFVRANNLLTDSQREAFQAAVGAKDAYGAQAIAMEALKARLAGAQQTFIDQKRALQDFNRDLVGAGPEGGAAVVIGRLVANQDIPTAHPTLEVPGTTAPSAQDQQANAIEEQHLGQLREEQALQSQLEVLQRRLASETDAAVRARTQAAIQDIQSQQAMLKARGDTSWERKQELAARQAEDAAVQGAKNRQQAEIAGAKAALAVWESAAQQTGITEQQRTEALLHASQERQRIRVMELTQGTADAKKGVEEQIAALSAQQAANTRNYDSWMGIERQKLAILRQAYGERSTQYQEELRREEEYQRQSADRKRQIDLETINSENAVGARRLQARIEQLQTELAAQRLTKQQEIALARQAAEAEYTTEAGRLQSLIASLDRETDAYRKATEEKNKLDAEHERVSEQYNREAAQAAVQAAQRQQQVYQQAFEGISSSASSALTGYVSGSVTWLHAEQQVARSILSSFTSMAEQMLSRWVATQLAERLASEQTQAAVAVAQEQGQSGLWTLLSRSVGLTQSANAAETASAVASEGRKTAATVSGNTTRTASNTAAESTENSWFLVRAAKWIASELGLTAATDTQTASRLATQSAADATSTAETSATNVAEAMSYAAVGGVAAGQSVAAIPYVGWAMAPGVAASTYAELAAMGSMAAFDKGSWDVPNDMVAQIHQGEMIVPRTYAESVRANAGGGHGGVSSSFSATYAPTFHGAAGTDMKAQSRRDFETMKRWTTDQTRNGRLAVVGR